MSPSFAEALWKTDPMIDPGLCHPNTPTSPTAYFANFSADALDLICEATRLRPKLRRVVSIECGVLWAAVRYVEAGKARCTCLEGVSSRSVEACFERWFRPEAADRDVELYQM